MKTGIVIQARLGSTRFPKKILQPFCGETILSFLVNRLKYIDLPIVVATTTNSKDDELVRYLEDNKILYFRGSEENVLQRFIDTANFFQLEKIIRICSDSPFVDPIILSHLLDLASKSDCEYFSFSLDNKPTVLSHIGVFGEYVKLSALIKLNDKFDISEYKEHVTFGIYNNKDLFQVKSIPIDDKFAKYQNIRLTLDTLDDYKNLIQISSSTDNINNLSAEEICKLVMLDKNLLESMSSIIQKNKK